MPKIFISYRRADSADISGRIADRLKVAFGESNVFFDITSVGYGDKFKKKITDYLSQSNIVLVIIGEQWAAIKDEDTDETRLHMTNDVVRYETDMALNHSDVKVIPVLVNTDSVLKKEILPDILQDIVSLNCAYIKSTSFERDIQDLIDFIKKESKATARQIDWRWWVAAVIVPLFAAVIAISPYLFNKNSDNMQETPALAEETEVIRNDPEETPEAAPDIEETEEASEVTPDTDTPTPTATVQTVTPTSTPTATETVTPTSTPTATETVTPTSTATDTATVTPTDDPVQIAIANAREFTGERNEDWAVFSTTFPDGHQMALVPSGCFTMGTSREQANILSALAFQADEFPVETTVHRQCIDSPFWIDVHEVTNGLYGETGSASCPGFNTAPDFPRTCVSWNEAQSYCESRGGYLPAEWEWEYAARGVESWIFPWGNEISEDLLQLSIVSAASRNEPVAISNPNYGEAASWIGALHMSGNVSEWTATAYLDDYANYDRTRQVDATGTMIFRGGSYLSPIAEMRLARRNATGAETRDSSLGFRCVIPVTSS